MHLCVESNSGGELYRYNNREIQTYAIDPNNPDQLKINATCNSQDLMHRTC